MIQLPIENEYFKLRKTDGVHYSYSHQFWRGEEGASSCTGEWSEWLPLKLFDEKNDALEVIGNNDEGWVFLFQIEEGFFFYDLRDWQLPYKHA